MKPYELWLVRGRHEKMLGSYVDEPKLKKAWLKHTGEGALKALHRVGDQEIVINDRMPIPELKEYRSGTDRDAKIMARAVYWTAVAFHGVGQYERHERPTRKEAVTLARKLAKHNKKDYMIYAVDKRELSAYAETVKWQGET